MAMGDGAGNFETMRADQSGLVVPGDAKSLTTVDLNSDHRPDFFVGINNRNAKVFENRSKTDAGVVHVKGASFGASVTFKWANGREQAREVYSTQGYLSQSPASFYFGTDRPVSAEVQWPNRRESQHKLNFENGESVVELPTSFAD